MHTLLAYVRLHEQGRAEVAVSPSTLAWYSCASGQAWSPGRQSNEWQGAAFEVRTICNGIQVDQTQGQWIDTLVEDKRASVADQVAAKLDVGAWFATLTRKMRQIAKDLAFGCSTSEVANKYGVTGRISQLRRTLEESWLTFQQEPETAVDSVTNFAKY